MDGEVGGEEDIGGLAFAVAEEGEDAGGVVDGGLVGEPVPDPFVRGAEGEFEAFLVEGWGVLMG